MVINNSGAFFFVVSLELFKGNMFFQCRPEIHFFFTNHGWHPKTKINKKTPKFVELGIHHPNPVEGVYTNGVSHSDPKLIVFLESLFFEVADNITENPTQPWEKHATKTFTLPETNSSPLKIEGWNTAFLLRRSIFRGHVSFREGTFFWFPCMFFACSKNVIQISTCSSREIYSEPPPKKQPTNSWNVATDTSTKREVKQKSASLHHFFWGDSIKSSKP